MYQCSDVLLGNPDIKERQHFGDQIAQFVHDYFSRKLPNHKGKPQLGHEWTVLAAIVIEKPSDKKHTDAAKVMLAIHHCYKIALKTDGWSSKVGFLFCARCIKIFQFPFRTYQHVKKLD